MKKYIVGHRGAGIFAPENTLRALQVAHDLGLSYVEFDVRLTKDNVPVISHDDSLMRCAHIDQLISESDYEDIKDINMAQHYALDNVYEKIPTLEEYLQEAKNLGLHCQVELKPNIDGERQLVEIVCEILDNFSQDMLENDIPLITSFVPKCLSEIKNIAKIPYKTGILVKVDETVYWKKLAEYAECNFVHLHALYLKEDIAKNVIDCGFLINGFHLNHPEMAKKAIKQGCQRFTCDIPDIFI